MLFFSFIFGVGVGAWVFNKMRHRTESSQTSVIVAIIVGAVAFIIFLTAAHTFFMKG